ncbi:alpha-glucosidase [Ruminococcaceae bacterium OttesenSCG-928-O06]|nr:alpha-glucosidase [Ruminococcaceae bacterium OttesenSCG-928-O06]
MPLTRRSRIKEAWQHPVGHDVLKNMLRRTGRGEGLLRNPVVANLPLPNLDRIAGPGFCDMLLDMAAQEPDIYAYQAAEGQAWWKEAVVYQIYLPSFMDSDHDGMGDLGGVIQRLPYLARLGVDTLWLFPLLDGAGCGGECARDFYGIQQDLGTMEDLVALTEQAHARGMRVVLGIDIAATSQEHPWFRQALEGEKSAFYYLRPGFAERPPNNWGQNAPAPAWKWYPEAEMWGLQLGGPGRMDLNWDNPTVRAKMAKVLNFWLGKGVDGFVFGPVNQLSKGNLEDGSPLAYELLGARGYEKYAYGPRLHRYLRELRAALPGDVLVAGEVRGTGTEMAKLFAAAERGELDMVVDTSHLAPKPPAPKQKNRSEDACLELADLKEYYLEWMDRYHEGWMPLFLESSNFPRIVSRLGAAAAYRTALAKLLATLMFTLRGTPVIYQGGELGLANTRFSAPEELRDEASLDLYATLRERMGEAAALQKVLATAADHARTPMPWNNTAKSGFTGAEPWMRLTDGTEHLNAAVQMEDANSVWSHYQKLIALRKKARALIYGSFNAVFLRNSKTFCYFRILEGEKWYVEMNLTGKEVVRPGRILRSQRLALSNYDTTARTLRPYEANVYRCD